VTEEMQAPQRCDFFISYTGADVAWAEWIAWQLKAAGYTVTIQAWHFRPGMNFVTQMRQALDACQRTVAVISQAYLEKSTYGSDEWTAAFTRDDPSSLSLLPVLVEKVELPTLLRPRVHIDLTDLEPEQAMARLLKGVHPGPVEPTEAPAFPIGARAEAAGAPRFPGGRPEIWNLPPRNAAFAGREDLLVELRERLRQSSTAAVVPAQALYGLGGVGKTQLALEYAYRYQSDYDLAWWIVAEAPGAISAGLAALAPRLGLVANTSQVADQEQLAALVVEALRQRERWLLIIDNAPDRQQVAPYLPQGAGQVLVTSRDPVWGGTAHPVKVNAFTRTESVAFLTQRTGGHDEAVASELAEELGDLPLALEQAAAYLEQTGMSLDRYLRLFRRRREELLKLGEPTAYQGTVDTTWKLAIEQLAAGKPAGPAGEALLHLCAFLAPEGIPLELLTEYPDLLPDELAGAAQDELALQHAVAALHRYSLVESDQDGLRVHRLVQAVVRAGMDEQATRDWAAAAVGLVAADLPSRSDDVEFWPACQRLLPHALAAAKGSVAVGVEHETAAIINNRVALYLWARAELQEAQEVLQQTHSMIEERLGPEHLCAAANLGTQGKVLRDLGDLDEAKRAHERALAIRERRRGVDHLEVAWSLGNLGKVLRELGDLNEAKRTHEKALLILESRAEDADVAWGLGNLGRTLRDLGDLDEAKRAHERALAIRERRRGVDHPDVAWSLRHLGDTLHALAQRKTRTRQRYLQETRDHYHRALAIFTERFGPDHPEVWATRRRLQFLPEGFGEPLEQSDAGFQLLFDGANLRPWWRIAGPGYFVALEGGILQTQGGMGLLWYAARRFGDFILRLDWMATSLEDNSGVFVRFPHPRNNPNLAVKKGYEIQIDDRPKSRREPPSVFQTGAIYQFKAPSHAAANPVGEWNIYEIQVVGQSYTVILNGHKVVDNWTGTGGRGTEGYIGLQNHHQGSRVRFRNIRLKEL
jgi:tetratricopeptide (TPR) repeat protein